MKSVPFLFSLVLALTGCAGAHSHIKAAAIDETAFAGIWNLYRHCRASTDPELQHLYAARLIGAALEQQDPPAILLKPLDRFVSKPPVRLAADPRALAADCALRGGIVALERGEHALAGEMFRWVLVRYQEVEYAYYQEQAHLGLLQLAVRMAPAPQPIPVSFPQ